MKGTYRRHPSGGWRRTLNASLLEDDFALPRSVRSCCSPQRRRQRCHHRCELEGPRGGCCRPHPPPTRRRRAVLARVPPSLPAPCSLPYEPPPRRPLEEWWGARIRDTLLITRLAAQLWTYLGLGGWGGCGGVRDVGGWSAGGCSAADAGCVRCCGGRWGVGERQGIGGPVQACAAGASDSLPLLMRTCGLPPASPPLSPHPFPTSQAGAGTSTSGGSCCFPPCYFRASCRWWPSTSSAPACCARCPTETRWACGRVGACWEGAVRGRRWREGGTAGCCDAPYRLHPELSEASPFVLAPPAQPRNRLDIFLPRKHWRREGPRPTVVFVTGGAWTIGYKASCSIVWSHVSLQFLLSVFPR